MINPDDSHLCKNHFENNLLHGLLHLPAESILTEENKFWINHPPGLFLLFARQFLLIMVEELFQ